MKKYRLRLDRKIIGYAEETSKGLLFIGKDWLYQNKGKVSYNEVDESTRIFDKLHREIFENDIVIFKINPKEAEQKAIVLFDDLDSQFKLYDIDNLEKIPLFIEDSFLFENDPLEVVSHVFNHDELVKKLKRKER